MLYILHPLNALLMIAMPIVFATIVARRWRAPWRLFGIGVITFIGSQVVHLPLNAGLTVLFKSIITDPTPQPWHLPFNAIVLGLTAGLCEESARYLGYRYLAPRARAFRDALLLGAGHGGIEAILLGVYVAYMFLQMVALQQTGTDSLGLDEPQLRTLQQQMTAYWSAPAYLTILGAVERLFALTVHVGLSVVVLQVFVRKQWRWLWLAIGYHAASDATTVWLVQVGWPAPAIEGIVGLFALGALAQHSRQRSGDPARRNGVDPDFARVVLRHVCGQPGRKVADRGLGRSGARRL